MGKIFRVIDVLEIMRMMYRKERNPPTKELYLKYGLSIRQLLQDGHISELDKYEDVKSIIWKNASQLKE
ncbi:hypothetical protein [Mammaliicoccus lentus]|uniref:hypothetical protein n=1 Tax=Mammaliicoccus lentus TaxID=42858 RepID=UPI002648118F|nr:hypothetical protein [Mammaliicoccus lentus]